MPEKIKRNFQEEGSKRAFKGIDPALVWDRSSRLTPGLDVLGMDTKCDNAWEGWVYKYLILPIHILVLCQEIISLFYTRAAGSLGTAFSRAEAAFANEDFSLCGDGVNPRSLCHLGQVSV